MRCTLPVCSVFFKNWSHVWSGRCTKTSHFLYVFLTREMLVQLVNFEKCHTPLRSWLSPTGTVSHTCSADPPVWCNGLFQPKNIGFPKQIIKSIYTRGRGVAGQGRWKGIANDCLKRNIEFFKYSYSCFLFHPYYCDNHNMICYHTSR
jgi:hypothetical protein